MLYYALALNTSDKNPNVHICNDCGCELILMEVTTFTIDNNRSPITKSTYRCSNDECQVASDKRTAVRIEAKRVQELARENRKNRSITLNHKQPA